MMNEFLNMTVLWAALAFVAVLIVMPFAIRLAVKCGFVDVPGGRKAHESPVPLVGGLVIFPLFMISIWMFTAEKLLALLGSRGMDNERWPKPSLDLDLLNPAR